MKIAFVRGAHLNPWELQTYAPLARRHDFVAVGADWQFYNQPIPETFWHIVRPHLWGASTARIHPQAPVYVNRLRSWTLGESYGLTGLDQAVGNADILHSAETHSTMTYQCLKIRKQRGCKVVATIWENLPHMGELHPTRKARKQRALHELDGLLAVTETSRRMLLTDGASPDRIDVIPMAVDLLHFKPMPRDSSWAHSWGLKPDEKVILFVGRWVEEKGIRELIRAIPEVLTAVQGPIRFCFVGNGPLESLLKHASEAYPGRLLLIPFAPYDQLPLLHNMADVFVLPSKPAPKWQEQFGYVLVESMACGKAIVTTRSGSIPDVVGNAASLIPSDDSSALAASIIKLLTSDSERQALGQQARERAEQHFNSERISRHIESFYERVLRRPA